MKFEKEWQKAKNILCIRLDSIGDVLMTTPAVRALKESLPGRRITLLTSRSGAGIAPLIPEVDETIPYDAPWMKATRPRVTSDEEFKMINRLYWSGFDAAVIFTVFSQNPQPAAFLAYMAEIPLLLGYSRENPYQLLTNWVPEVDDFGQPDMRHEVRRQLDLVATIGCHPKDEHLSLEVPLRAVSRVLQMLADMGLNLNRPWAIMHPGATAPSRCYPPQHFAAAAEQLASDYDIQIVFSGVRTESEIVEEIRTSMQVNSFSVAGALNIKEFSALVSLAPLLISNNTGPAHIAAATGTPVVDLYALTNPQHTPWMVLSRVLYHDVSCKFCYKSVCPMGHHDCLRLVPPGTVVQAALELLNEANLMKRQEARTLSLT